MDEKFTPTCRLIDAERFKDVKKCSLRCKPFQISDVSPVVSVATSDKDKDKGGITSGYHCVTPQYTQADHWGYETHVDHIGVIGNKVDVIIRRHVVKHGTCGCVFEDSSCYLKSRHPSVMGGVCLAHGCQGSMKALFIE